MGERPWRSDQPVTWFFCRSAKFFCRSAKCFCHSANVPGCDFRARQISMRPSKLTSCGEEKQRGEGVDEVFAAVRTTTFPRHQANNAGTDGISSMNGSTGRHSLTGTPHCGQPSRGCSISSSTCSGTRRQTPGCPGFRPGRCFSLAGTFLLSRRRKGAACRALVRCCCSSCSRSRRFSACRVNTVCSSKAIRCNNVSVVNG